MTKSSEKGNYIWGKAAKSKARGAVRVRGEKRKGNTMKDKATDQFYN